MKLFKNFKSQKGFTLIELLVVIGILAVLLAITLIAINPARQFAQANDTKRRNDVNTILNAVNQYMADNAGALPAGITTTVATIATDDGVDPAEADICADLVDEYVAALPVDPLVSEGVAVTDCAVVGGYDTDYTIVQSATNSRITVVAPNVEITGEVISVTR